MKSARLPDAPVPALRRIQTRHPRVDLRRFPDFLLIGPQRTGTTWLYRNLRQHPHIFMPDVKETYYFSTLGQPEHEHFRHRYLEDYLALFHDTTWRRIERHYDCLRQSLRPFCPRICGEATATYATLDDDIIADIATLNPDIQAVMLLRDPVERAWSHAKKELIRDAADPTAVPVEKFLHFFEKQGQRRRGDYASIIDRWQGHLKPGSLYIGDYRRVAEDPAGLLRDLARFLGITPHALFFNRHLRGRINPSREFPIPDAVRAHLESQHATDRATCRKLLERSQAH